MIWHRPDDIQARAAWPEYDTDHQPAHKMRI